MSIFGASVSGMGAMSNWLSTIAQNVANANSTGFKTNSTHFASLVDQASVGSFDAGGGVSTRLRSLNNLQGSIVNAASVTDLAVAGSGFFVVSDRGGAMYLTRSGSFVPDAAGDLVNASGYYLMGYDLLGPPVIRVANSLDAMARVNIGKSQSQATPTTTGTFSANLPADAAVIPAGSLASDNAATSTYTEKTSLVTYDNLGGQRTLDIYLTKLAPNSWEAAIYDHADAPVAGGFPYANAPLAVQSLAFDPLNGKLSTGSPLTLAVPGGQTMTMNLANMTQLSAPYSVGAATTNGGAISNLNGVSIGANGTMSFQFNNGTSSAAYDIPLANVPSPVNLRSINGTAYQVDRDSGAVLLGQPGSDGFGSIQSSALENSTVDLAQELTQMIEAQSSYQANSKVFQTGADILNILNNLKP